MERPRETQLYELSAMPSGEGKRALCLPLRERAWRDPVKNPVPSKTGAPSGAPARNGRDRGTLPRQKVPR